MGEWGRAPHLRYCDIPTLGKSIDHQDGGGCPLYLHILAATAQQRYLLVAAYHVPSRAATSIIIRSFTGRAIS